MCVFKMIFMGMLTARSLIYGFCAQTDVDFEPSRQLELTLVCSVGVLCSTH